ncbi:MAG: protein kinase [Pyrinomonadaceae bacterium]|nr:protein kinase [Pyrinomonadaceae bacterium]
MAYCHECGSEVAPNDVFCPFCGIFLNPAPAVEEESNSLPPTAKKSESEDSPEVSPTAITEDDLALNSDFSLPEIPAQTAPAAELVADVNDDFSLSETEDDLDLSGVSADLKLPVHSEENKSEEPISPPIADQQLQEDLNKTAFDENPEKSTGSGEVSFDEIPTPALIEESAPNFGSPFIPAAEKNESDISQDYPVAEESGETLNKESAVVEESLQPLEVPASEEIRISKTELEVPNHESSAEEVKNEFPFKEEKDPFSETIPDMSAAFNLSEEKAEEPLQTEVPESSFSEEVKEIEPFELEIDKSEPVNSSVPEIEMPSEELEKPDFHHSQSVFDSVRIMETEPAKSEEKVEIPVASSFVESIAQAPETQTPVSENLNESKENRSYTTPNIGGSDTDGKKAAKLKPLDEGTVLNGRYEIIRKIGGGGMGAVYLASDNNLGGVLRAVKEMVQSYIEETQQEKAIADFKRESMILSTLDHPSIPTIYDYFYDDKESRFYLVMKYISGGDLSGKLRSAPEGKLEEQTVTEWAIQVTDVLHYLHNQPNTIVYRDLKPSNVMIDGNSGRIMLIDFGIARSVNKEEKGVTAVGTMGYAPPELFSGNVEPRSDIYSLGSTMFHLLTGADPQSNPLLIFDFQKNPRPRQINSQLSDQMERILMRAVEYNATSRFASAAELKQILEEHLSNLKTGRVTYGVTATPVAVSLQDQPVFCGFCGQKIMATDMFCAFCGSKQPLSQKGVHSEIYSHAPVAARLMVIGTNELDAPIFNIEKDDSLVGRRDPMSNIFPEVDLSKYDPQTKISRRHARIRRDGNNFYLEDLGSSNGTIIIPAVSDMTRLLPHQPHVLANGDKIRVGDTTLHFVIN